jgi:hypothetical protein
MTTTKKRGRPNKLTKEMQDKLCAYIAEGQYITTACRLVGVDYATMRRWILQGEQDMSGKFYEFQEAISQAEALAEAERVKLILQAGKYDDWKANAWYLERKFPEKWGRKDRIDSHVTSEHTERQEHYIEHQIESDPETVELVRQLWRRQQAMGEIGGDITNIKDFRND